MPSTGYVGQATAARQSECSQCRYTAIHTLGGKMRLSKATKFQMYSFAAASAAVSLSLLVATSRPEIAVAHHSFSLQAGETVYVDPTQPNAYEMTIAVPCPEAMAIMVTATPSLFMTRATEHGSNARLTVDGASAHWGILDNNGQWTRHVSLDLTEQDSCLVEASVVATVAGSTLALRAGDASRSLSLNLSETPAIATFEAVGDIELVVLVELDLNKIEVPSRQGNRYLGRRGALGALVVCLVFWFFSTPSGTVVSRVPSSPWSTRRRTLRKQPKDRGPRRDRAPGLRIVSVAAVAVMSALLMSPVFDDGWILSRSLFQSSGPVSFLDTHWRGMIQVQGYFYEIILSWLSQSGSLILLRLPNLLATVISWKLIESIITRLDDRPSSARIYSAFFIFIAIVPVLVRTYRPEAIIIVLLLSVLRQHDNSFLLYRTLGLSVVVPASIAVALHQTGWVVVFAGLPLLFNLMTRGESATRFVNQLTTLRPLNARGYLFIATAACAVVSVGLLSLFWHIDIQTFRNSAEIYNLYFGGRPAVAPHLEWERYVNVWTSGSLPLFVLSVLIPLAVAVLLFGLRQRHAGSSDRTLAAACATSSLGFLLTSSKWEHHVVVGGIVVVAAILLTHTRGDSVQAIRTRSQFEFLASMTLAVTTATFLTLRWNPANPVHPSPVAWSPQFQSSDVRYVFLALMVAFAIKAAGSLGNRNVFSLLRARISRTRSHGRSKQAAGSRNTAAITAFLLSLVFVLIFSASTIAVRPAEDFIQAGQIHWSQLPDISWFSLRQFRNAVRSTILIFGVLATVFLRLSLHQLVGVGYLLLSALLWLIPNYFVPYTYSLSGSGFADLVMAQRGTLPVDQYVVAVQNLLRPVTRDAMLIGMFFVFSKNMLAVLNVVRRRSTLGSRNTTTSDRLLFQSAASIMALSLFGVIVAPVTAMLARDMSSSFGTALATSEFERDGACGLLKAGAPVTSDGKDWFPSEGDILKPTHPMYAVLFSCVPFEGALDGRWQGGTLEMGWPDNLGSAKDRLESEICFTNPNLAAPCIRRLP